MELGRRDLSEATIFRCLRNLLLIVKVETGSCGPVAGDRTPRYVLISRRLPAIYDTYILYSSMSRHTTEL